MAVKAKKISWERWNEEEQILEKLIGQIDWSIWVVTFTGEIKEGLENLKKDVYKLMEKHSETKP